MGEPLTREEFLIHIEYVRKDVGAVVSHLETLNGRTRTNENEIARLDERIKAAADAAEKAAETGGVGKGAAAAWGGGIGGGLIAIVEAARYFLNK